MSIKIRWEDNVFNMPQMKAMQWGTIAQMNDKNQKSKFGDVVYCTEDGIVVNITQGIEVETPHHVNDVFIRPIPIGTEIEIITEV